MVTWLISAFSFITFFLLQLVVGVVQLVLNLIGLIRQKNTSPGIRKMTIGYWACVLTYLVMATLSGAFETNLESNWVVWIAIPASLALFSLAIPVSAIRR